MELSIPYSEIQKWGDPDDNFKSLFSTISSRLNFVKYFLMYEIHDYDAKGCVMVKKMSSMYGILLRYSLSATRFFTKMVRMFLMNSFNRSLWKFNSSPNE